MEMLLLFLKVVKRGNFKFLLVTPILCHIIVKVYLPDIVTLGKGLNNIPIQERRNTDITLKNPKEWYSRFGGC